MEVAATLLLTDGDIAGLLDRDELVEVMAGALRELSAGQAGAPARIAVRSPAGLLAAMPAQAGEWLACKLVSVFAGNHGGPLPSHQALVALFDAGDGSLRALLEGALLTSARTAAVSALAVRTLVPPAPGVLAVLGAGAQARAHLQAVPRVREFAEIRVASRTPAHAAALACEFGARACDSIEAAVRGAAVVCACTNAATPVVRREWLAPGCTVTSVGIGGAELDAATLDDAGVLVVESRIAFAPFPAGAHELQGRNPGQSVELGEMLANPLPARRSAIHVFKSVGHAVEDAAAAAWLYRRARAAQRGKLFVFSTTMRGDESNPAGA